MTDFDLKNHSEEEALEEIRRRMQSTGVDLLDELEKTDAKTDPRATQTTAELVFKHYRNTQLEDDVRERMESLAQNHPNKFCRQALNATLATCLDEPEDAHIAGLEAVAKNARDKFSIGIEESAHDAFAENDGT